MKIGTFTVPLYDRSTEEAFKFLSSHGVQAVEIGTGGYPGTTHCNPAELLENPAKLQHFKDLLERYNLEISALSCHSNHVHPDEVVRKKAAQDFTLTFKLAQKLGIDTVVTFSGCPAGHKDDVSPNWSITAWPEDFSRIHDYQWNEVLIPFWKGAVVEAKSYGVNKIAIEMHPGFTVYNPQTLLRLRDAVGPEIGANFDPSHLFWQGIKPACAIKDLSGKIYHFHAKDTKINNINTARDGVLDAKSFENLADRSWIFRTVGFGASTEEWKEIISALKLAGYNGALSIEHEDGYMSKEEGLIKGIEFLKSVIIRDDGTAMWWA